MHPYRLSRAAPSSGSQVGMDPRVLWKLERRNEGFITTKWVKTEINNE